MKPFEHYDAPSPCVTLPVEKFKEAMKSHRKAQDALIAEFWADCRKEIGYDSWLNPAACVAVEREAWERGHYAGFSEVFNCLTDVVDFASRLLACQNSTCFA
jgi:hypothetical protein